MRDTLALALIRAELCRVHAAGWQHGRAAQPRRTLGAVIADALGFIAVIARRNIRRRRVALPDASSPPD
jgi:hypothetical protein